VTMATQAIFDAHLSDDRAKMFFHSSSYTANPIACAAAVSNLEIWRDEPVLERIAGLGERQQARLDALAGVMGKRRIGTIAAMEVPAGDGGYLAAIGPRLLKHFRELNVLLRPLGNTVYVMPPYCISDAELDTVYNAIATAV